MVIFTLGAIVLLHIINDSNQSFRLVRVHKIRRLNIQNKKKAFTCPLFCAWRDCLDLLAINVSSVEYSKTLFFHTQASALCSQVARTQFAFSSLLNSKIKRGYITYPLFILRLARFVLDLLHALGASPTASRLSQFGPFAIRTHSISSVRKSAERFDKAFALCAFIKFDD